MDPSRRRGQGRSLAGNGGVSEEPALSLLGYLIMTRQYRAGHGIGGVHNVRLGHRKSRDVVGDRVEVLGIACTLRGAGAGTTDSGNKREAGNDSELRMVHQLIRSGEVFSRYCR